MLIMPLAILLLSSTIVMATSNSILPPAAYAITFGSTKNLSNNAGDSFDPRIEASGNNVYTVWNDRSGGEYPIHSLKKCYEWRQLSEYQGFK